MNWFKFKDKYSYEFDNIIVNELPQVIKPAEKITTYDIDGRNGNLTVFTGTYETMTKSIQCTLKDLSGIDEIFSWLRGAGDIVFSNQPDRYYKAKIINQIPFDRVIRQFRSFIIELEVQPFAYLIDDNIITATSSTVVNNLGNVYSEPIIKIYGNGAGNFKINDATVTLKNLTGGVVIDSELFTCTKPDGTLWGKYMVGDFPTLQEGENNISFSGGISKLEIIPRWRVV